MLYMSIFIGTAGDSMSIRHNGMYFTTFDRDIEIMTFDLIPIVRHNILVVGGLNSVFMQI